MPLPLDLHEMPSLDEMLWPSPEVQAAVVADAEAVVREAAAAAGAAVAPSPARAEPHDPASWMPLPDPDSLVTIPELESGVVSEPRRPERRLATRSRAVLRWLCFVVLVAATVTVGVKAVTGTGAPATLGTSFTVVVDLDGVTRVVHTTERSAQGLVRTLHVGKLVAVRNIPGPLHAGSQVVLRTRHNGVLAVDGQEIRFDSASRTVDELLASYSVWLSGEDFTTPANTSLLVNGQTIAVTRIGASTKQRFETIPPAEIRQPDPSLAIGQTRVIREGVPGATTVTYRERIENGAVVGVTTLSKVRSRLPISRIIGYGTKADWHWDALAKCESGGRWSTVDAGPGLFDGGLGIYRGTWATFGGREFAPNAGLATREEQIIVGMRIYTTYGWSAWGCGRKMHW
jgi:uncharacterized protein YabE (DUF348 family)